MITIHNYHGTLVRELTKDDLRLITLLKEAKKK